MAKCRGVLRILSNINDGDFNKKSSIRILNRVLNMLLKSVRKGPSQYLLIPYKQANITFLRYCKLAWENFQSVSLYRDCRSAISINHQRVKEMPSPFPCSSVIFEWLWKEAQIKKMYEHILKNFVQENFWCLNSNTIGNAARNTKHCFHNYQFIETMFTEISDHWVKCFYFMLRKWQHLH